MGKFIDLKVAEGSQLHNSMLLTLDENCYKLTWLFISNQISYFAIDSDAKAQCHVYVYVQYGE